MGRAAERTFLKEAYESAADGRGTVISLIGAPGVGKSRLVHDFIRLDVGGDWRVFETACASQRTSSSYDAISMLVRTWFKIGSGDAPETMAQRVCAKIAEIDVSLLPYMPAILSLLDVKSEELDWQSLDPVQRRQKMSESVRALILAQARAGPLLILVEDVHWADTETILVLDRLAAALNDVPLLVITTRRPESGTAVASSPDQPRLVLSPLDAVASGQLLDWLMGDDIALTQLKRRVLTQAEGNPLFLEELVRSLKESNVLEGERGHYHVGKPAEHIEIPQTIQSVLATRIDLLDGMPKTVLQTSAIIGKDVSFDLLSRMIDIPAPQLSAQLEQLEAADLVYPVTLGAGAEYSFKHELTREVAYNTVLIARRRTLHSKVLQIIEANFAHRLDEHIDRLAEHAYSGELWEKAVPYQLRSARRAMKRWANHEVIRIVERGLETLSHLPDTADKWKAAVDFRLAAVIALEPLGRHRRLVAVMSEASKLTEAAGDPRRTAAVNCQLAAGLWRLGKHDAAMAAAEAAYAIANTIGSAPLGFAALHNIGIIHHETGAFKKAVEVHRRCQAIFTPDLDVKRAGWASYPSVTLHTFLADSLLELGELAEAEAMAEEAVRLADAVNHAYSRSLIYHIRARIHLAKGEVAAAVALMEEAWRICVDLEIIQMYPVTAARLGEAYLYAGNIDAALKVVSLPEKLDVPQAENNYGWYHLFLAQGRTFLMSGQHAQAFTVAKRALQLAEERGERPQQAHALKLLGEICAASKQHLPAEAEKYLRTALALAEDCSMRLLAERCKAALGKVGQP
jgi:tetratricopeptide (TPR) repeat protein